MFDKVLNPLRRQRANARRMLHEYSRPFWVLVATYFIDRLGGAFVFPFFTLYVTARYGVSMTTVGLAFGVMALSSAIGTTVGGALADRVGRKVMLLVGLLASGLSAIGMGLAPTFPILFVVAVGVALVGDAGMPAGQAMVADLVPPEKRGSAYGLIRVAANLAITIGPALGGLIAARSYMALFILDAVLTSIAAVFAFFLLPETLPERTPEAKGESMLTTLRGYGTVLKDRVFLVILLAWAVLGTVYMQMNVTLAPFLRDTHGLPESGFGFLLAMNAFMVVVFQFRITRETDKHPPLPVVALGAALVAVGLGMFGLGDDIPWFVLSMVILTIGEMIAFPVSQVIVAALAPEDKRGRYMAAFGWAWTVAVALGPLLGGLVLDNFVPQMLWIFTGLVGLVSAGLFLVVRSMTGDLPQPAAAQAGE